MGVVTIENSKDGRYKKKFKKDFRERFKTNQEVITAKRENPGTNIENEDF